MKRLLVFVMGVFLISAATPLYAHHSASSYFDMSEKGSVKVTGVLVKVEWTNPHVWYYLDVKDQSGKVTTWGFEAPPPAGLLRRGVKKESLKLGETITVQGFRAKDGSNNATALQVNSDANVVTFSDGRQVFPAYDSIRTAGSSK